MFLIVGIFLTVASYIAAGNRKNDKFSISFKS